mgnify:CR=1 FL=1
MRNLLCLLVLATSFSALKISAQEPDSVVVIYNCQRTVIPVPEFGKQTTIKMTDSIQIIEFGVVKRKNTGVTTQQQYIPDNQNNNLPKSRIKRFSQIEAGYTLDLFPSYLVDYATHSYLTKVVHYNTDNISGYKIGLSIQEKENYFNSRFSFSRGFKLGFAQSIRSATDKPIVQDTLEHVFIGYDAMRQSHFQILFPFGLSYNLNLGSQSGKITIGTNLGTSIDFITAKYTYEGITRYEGSPLFIQPNIGLEVGKFGVLALSGFTFYPNYLLSPDNNVLQDYLRTKTSFGLSITYRFF